MIGERIKELLNIKGMSQRELARRLGKHPSEVSEIVKGKRDPGIALVKKIAAGLGVSASELIGDSENEISVSKALVREVGEARLWEFLELVRKIKSPPR